MGYIIEQQPKNLPALDGPLGNFTGNGTFDPIASCGGFADQVIVLVNADSAGSAAVTPFGGYGSIDVALPWVDLTDATQAVQTGAVTVAHGAKKFIKLVHWAERIRLHSVLTAMASDGFSAYVIGRPI